MQHRSTTILCQLTTTCTLNSASGTSGIGRRSDGTTRYRGSPASCSSRWFPSIAWIVTLLIPPKYLQPVNVTHVSSLVAPWLCLLAAASLPFDLHSGSDDPLSHPISFVYTVVGFVYSPLMSGGVCLGGFPALIMKNSKYV